MLTAGMKSSEFWLTVALFIAGNAMIAWGTLKGDAVLVDHGSTLSAAAVGGYSIARGISKHGK